MEDTEIVKLYFDRNEAAITESDAKYGGMLMNISYNILSDREDSRECVNDTYQKAWSSIPPNKTAGRLYRLRVKLKSVLEKEGVVL